MIKKNKLKVYPENSIEKLEFDQILDLSKQYCMGEMGKRLIDRTWPSVDVDVIKYELLLSTEIKKLINDGISLPLSNYTNIRDDLSLLKKIDYILNIESIKNIYYVVFNYLNILNDLTEEKRLDYPLLSDLFVDVKAAYQIIPIIQNIFTSEFIVKDSASPELASIRKVLKRKLREIDGAFLRAVKLYKGKGFLTDTVESVKNGRRVLSAKVEFKRQIKGVIHDDSATGKTVFIEPQEVLQHNYDLFDLYLEEKNEIKRILGNLCNELRPFDLDINNILKTLAKYDSCQAKTRLALTFNGVAPKIETAPILALYNAYHPLLFLKNKLTKEKTIPFDLKLEEDNKILVISGPNAGGKSVTLKTIGLLQMMVQSGYLVPVSKQSSFGFFDKIFTDIGDQQSIEKDLSTYSSRLINHKKILLHTTEKSLVLIDEFGSGTDPQIGGTIAEAILHQLTMKNVFGVITTHYSNLKIFAHKTKGIVNGAMSFDLDSLLPTYNLILGEPGSSYAYEISERIGLPKKIIKYAQKVSGSHAKDVEQVLADLRANLSKYETQQESVLQKEIQLDKMIKVYETLFNELDVKRKRLKSAQKETHLSEINKLKQELKDAVSKLEKNASLNVVANVKKKLNKKQNQLKESLVELKSDLAESKPTVTPVVGDYVQIGEGGVKGDVVSIRKDKATVQMGMMTMEVPLYNLDVLPRPLKNKYKKGVSINLSNSSSLQSSNLDIRGMMPSEAMVVLEDFFDNNLLSDNRVLEIIHGKGTGVLRNLVKQKIKEYKLSAKVYHPTPKGGGNGKTIIEFN